jgi:hypothetical protein
MHLRMERLIDLRAAAGEFDPLPATRDRIDAEAAQRQPGLDLLQVDVIRPEAGGDCSGVNPR